MAVVGVRNCFRFQSTHPCGVRRGHRPSERLADGFNPRTPAGCDILYRNSLDPNCSVSIHAPLRGATCPAIAGLFLYTGFNPRTPAGCDCGVISHHQSSRCFNPRTPAGCDLRTRQIMPRLTACFNPRTPAGCDAGIKLSDIFGGCFNPRTPAGCDKDDGFFRVPKMPVSIHAPLRGAT